MSDAAKAQSGKVRIGVALVAVSLAGLAAAVYFTGSLALITELISDFTGTTARQGPVTPKPSGSTTGTPPPLTPTEDGNGGGAAATPEDVAYFREWMYWEQVDSQESIGELVSGEWASFNVTGVNQDGTTANLRIAGTHKSGTSLQGTLVLRRIGSNWFFVKITADDKESLGPAGRRGADYGVVKTIVSEQAEPADQALIAGLKDGGYKTISVNRVKKGSSTATIDLTLSGGAKGSRAGRIVCVTKTVDGRKYWFITGCEER